MDNDQKDGNNAENQLLPGSKSRRRSSKESVPTDNKIEQSESSETEPVKNHETKSRRSSEQTSPTGRTSKDCILKEAKSEIKETEAQQHQQQEQQHQQAARGLRARTERLSELDKCKGKSTGMFTI